MISFELRVTFSTPITVTNIKLLDMLGDKTYDLVNTKEGLDLIKIIMNSYCVNSMVAALPKVQTVLPYGSLGALETSYIKPNIHLE